NAYGHGLLLASRAFVDAGADWLSVDSLHESRDLRDAGIDVPLLVLGYVPPEQAPIAVGLGCRIVVYSRPQVDALALASRAANTTTPLHVKIETGTYRQGLEADEALALATHIDATDGVVLEGIATHFANVEDTTDHSFARKQLAAFNAMAERLQAAGI